MSTLSLPGVRTAARAGSWLAAGLVVSLVLSGLVAAPAQAQAEPPDEELPPVECPEFDGEPAAEDELTAYQYALACGVDVEVLGLRDVDRQVFATPEGLLDAQVAVEPFWVPDATGQWVDIDPTLVEQAGGSAVAAATVIDIAVGAGGGDPFVTATDPDGGSLSLMWPGGGLPAPVLDGAVATYPEVLPGVDLAVQAEPVGFSWVLVVKTAQAAADPALAEIAIGIDTVGLAVVEDTGTGRIEVADDTGAVVFEAGQAIMWDSSVAGGEGAAAAAEAPSLFAQETTEEPPADPGRIGDVEVEVTSAGIDLVPDAEMLADETVTFPVYIDPPFTSTRKAWANVYAGRRNQGWTGDSSWPRAGGMRVGYNTWPTCGDGCGLWRSVITLNIGKLNGKYIASAAVKALQTHTGGCGSYGLQLWRTKRTSNGVSWNGVSWLYGSQLQTKSPPSSNTTGGCGSGNSHEWVAYDGANVKRRVQSAADQRYDTISFGFQSTSEGDRNAWRRLRTSSVRLEVKYYIYPPKPDMRKINGTPCKTSRSSALWMTSRTPTLSVRARSYESESVYVRLRVRKQGAGSNYWWYRTPDPVGSYSTVNRRLTTSLPDGEYTWQTRADSRHTNAVNSGYTDYCYFKVDATKPSTPTVTAPAGPFNAGDDVTLGVSSSDPIVNGVHSGLDRYEYSWNTPVFDRQVAPNGSTTITLADAAAGRHVLYVRSVDNAGNTSNQRTYTFFAGSDIPATPMAAWRLGGDAADDSGPANDLVMAAGDGPVFADYDGDRALKLDGSTCLTADAPVRTDAAFTVALRVRMDAKPTSYAKVLTQGSTRSVYQIQYTTSVNKWYFSMLSEDYNWYSIGATNPAALGEWLHITGTYDPDAGIARMYLNGELAAERTVNFEPWNAMDTFGVGCLRGASGSTGHYFTGAVDNVGVWSGLLSTSAISNHAQLPDGEIGRWRLNGDGADATRFGRDLTLPESAEQSFDPFARPAGALVLDGESCATSAQPIIPSDAPFGVSAWVKPAEVGSHQEPGSYQVIAAQADGAGNGFVLGIDQRGRWEWGPASSEPPATSVAGTESTAVRPMVADPQDPVEGQWQQVAFRYDGDGKWSLHVNGEYELSLGTFTPAYPTFADVPLTLGCVDWGQGEASHLRGMLHDVRVWRGDPGRSAMPGLDNSPAELQGSWRLEGRQEDRDDDSSGNGQDLTFEGDTSVNDGYSCDPDGALELAGAGNAATAGPVVATDESFTVSAWVRMDRLDTDMAFVSAVGQQTTAFRLRYSQSQQQFGFVMMSEDVASPSWRTVYGGPTPEVDTWYHLVGVYDLYAGELRLYLSGELVGTRTGTSGAWHADGPLVIGAYGTPDGRRHRRMQGAIDDVVVWQSVVPEHVIDNMSNGPIPKC